MSAPKVTPAQRKLLSALADGEPRTSSDLAAGARSKAGTTTALRTLTRLGLVEGRRLWGGPYAECEYHITDAGRAA